MLFRKSPGNEKFVSLKCMLNAKACGIYSASIARTRGYLRPTRWLTRAALIDLDCGFSQKDMHPNAHQAGQQQGGGAPQRSRGASQPSRQTKKEPIRLVGWRRPTLPQGCPCSTIGACGLNFRVRYGTGCTPTARIASPQEALALVNVLCAKR